MNIFLVLIIIGASVLPSWAEETALSLDEVVVTATRTEEETVKIPANVTVITQEEIRKSPAKTVPDLLREEEGINVIDLYGSGTKSAVDMRGFARGINTLVMLDGRKLNKIDLEGVDWNLVPLENVERIEVVRGTESALYGDNSMAGVINIITKKGTSTVPEFELDGRLESYSGYSEYASFQGANAGIGYFFFAKRRDTNGYRSNSDFHANDFSTRITLNPNDIFSIDFSAGYHDDRQGLPGALTDAEMSDDRRQTMTPDDHVSFNERYFDIKSNIALGAWGDLEFGYTFNNYKYDAVYMSFGGFLNNRETDTIGLKVKLTADMRIAGKKSLLVTGVDYYDSSVENRTSFNSGELSKTDIGLYLQNELSLTEKLILSFGYRYAHTKYDFTTIDVLTTSGNTTYSENALKLGLVYLYTNRSKVFLSYAKGYRLPTTDELINWDGTVASLKPETSDTYEAGITHRFGNHVETRLTVYTMNIRDELIVDPFVDFFTGNNSNINLDKTRHSGVEAGVTASITKMISAYGNVTYSDATIRSGPYHDNTIPQIPRYSANIGLDMQMTKALLASVKANWIGNRYLLNDLQNAFSKQDSYTTLNAKLSYTYRNMTAYVGLNNILNEKYSEYAAVNQVTQVTKFGPSPELNYYAGLKLNF